MNEKTKLEKIKNRLSNNWVVVITIILFLLVTNLQKFIEASVYVKSFFIPEKIQSSEEGEAQGKVSGMPIVEDSVKFKAPTQTKNGEYKYKENKLSSRVLGKVIDSQGLGIQGVMINGKNAKCYSDSDGYFSINLDFVSEREEIGLTFSKAGYSEVKYYVNFSKGQIEPIKLIKLK